MKKKRMKMKKNRGFTLIELLIVIGILAILYSMAAANVMGLQTEAKVSRAMGDLKTLKLALDTYVKNNDACPKKEDYQYLLIRTTPNILPGNLFDPFAVKVNTLYSFDISDNDENYVVYSIGVKKNGKASIGNDGMVLTEGAPIIETNGYD
jgi:general secretion pathway protein G